MRSAWPTRSPCRSEPTKWSVQTQLDLEPIESLCAESFSLESGVPPQPF